MPTRFALAQCSLIALLAAATAAAPAKAQDAPADLHWFKGNTHTHTINSDGDSSPDDVVKWYRTHGYQFVVPRDAVLRSESGYVVYVVVDQGGETVAEVRPVQTGAGEAGRVLVESGLAVGDRVVVVGQQQLANGDRVRVTEATGGN